jgi:FAD/FMN-containing dehydrogenase/Fe-S oxidoreductase
MQRNSLSLPVVTTPAAAEPDMLRDTQRHELSSLNVGQLRFSRHDRTLYATDASLYQVTPLAVVIPENIDQLRRLLRFCAQEKLPVLLRGGGTSLAGQCTNRAIVVDFSPHWRTMRDPDVSGRTCIVEPGISIDQINHNLAAQNIPLFFAPDPASSAQASIGGCISNNAAGARSIRYGRTSENLAGIQALLSTGENCWLQKGAGRADSIALGLARQTAAVVGSNAELIRRRFPKLIRRNAGYSLDLILNQLDAGIEPEDLDLSGLICGSEGTLVVITAARLMLHRLPAARGLAVVGCTSLEDAIDLVVPILAVGPSAVELLDDVVIHAAAGNSQCRRYLDLLPKAGDQIPAAVLYIEFEADENPDSLVDHFATLKNIIKDRPCSTYQSPDAMNQAWMLRKSSEALLHAVSAGRKPITFVEDNAVPPVRLAEFVAKFKRIMAAHSTSAAFYAHASVGVLHVRPLLDPHLLQDRQAMQEIALEVSRLARDCAGVLSGEHGDGRVRGPLLEEFYGSELMQVFRRIKEIFDPSGILNPGMIVEPGAVENITRNLRIDAVAPGTPSAPETFFDYCDQEHFRGAIEMCNGAGFCRKISGGTMCPSYRATLDERHSPRGRANALRSAILEPSTPVWDDPETLQTLDLCLSCKACKTECPSSVDIARLKAEYLAQSYRLTGTPLAARAFGHIRELRVLGSLAPDLANLIQQTRPVRAALNRLLGLAPQRPLPRFSRSLYQLREGHKTNDLPPEAPRVMLFGDCFTAWSESHIGIAALRVLNYFGYRVELPRLGCCGRALISTGLVDRARSVIGATLESLRNNLMDSSVRAILVLEPSCLSAMLDDWISIRGLKRGNLSALLSSRVMLVEDFLDRFWDFHPRRLEPSGSGATAVFHGHCHQKALWGTGSSAQLLRRILGSRLNVLATGCCGMAGAFGYTRDHYDLSMRIFQAPEFNPVREAVPDSHILATGASCREQITHAIGRRALHPVELIDELIGA